MLNLFIVYKMELNENADPDKYGYSGCVIGLDIRSNVSRNGQ